MIENTADSILNADLTSVDTSFPVLEEAVYPVTIAGCEIGESKEKKTPMLYLNLSISIAAKTTTGQIKQAGFKIRDQVSLNPTYESDGTTLKYDPRQRLKAIKEAVFGDGSGTFGDPASYIGHNTNIRLKVTKSEEFGLQNRVAAYVKVNS